MYVSITYYAFDIVHECPMKQIRYFFIILFSVKLFPSKTSRRTGNYHEETMHTILKSTGCMKRDLHETIKLKAKLYTFTLMQFDG